MRIRHLVWPTLLTGAAASGVHAQQQPNYHDVFGAANINPAYFLTPQDSVNEAANQLVDTGSSAIKLEMDSADLDQTFSANSKYAWNTPNWPPSSGLTLTVLAESQYFSKAFSNPNIKSYDLTTRLSSVVGGGDPAEYWLNGMTAAQKQAETGQFYDLTKYLLQTYNGTGKTFYLSDWEGDWAINGANRDTRPTATAIQGMIDWFNAREAGIREAEQTFGAASNVHVYQTVEVNRVQDAMNGDIFQDSVGTQTNWATVTNDVLPHTDVDFVSYSSYDTQQHLTTTGTAGHLSVGYADAVKYIAAHLPASAVNGQNTHSVYVGEYGLAEDSAGITNVNIMMNNVINTVKADGMPMALYWELYSNELTGTTPPGNTGNNSEVKGFYFVKPDGTPATAWHQYRYLLSTSDPTQSSTAAVQRGGLHLAYASNFTAPGATLGSAWTTNTSGGAASVGISNGQVQMTTLNGTSTPVAQATLNIDSVLGRGLNPGEYLQFTLNRQQDAGIVGFTAFTQNHGSGIGAGNQPLNVFSKNAWTYVSFNPNGTTAAPSTSFNWDNVQTLGLRLDAADGNFADVSYYINGSYAGSWLYQTASKALDSFSLFSQSSTTNAGFGFNNLTIYTANGTLASTGYQWDPNKNRTGGTGTWDSGTNANFFNGTSDVTWNNATLGDNVAFGSTAGTVTVAAGGVTASTLNFSTPGYTVTGGAITMMGNQTINSTSGAATINSAIAGTSGLTVTGAGSVTLGATNSFSGGLYVNSGGTASFTVDGNLGAAGQPINLDGGTLNYTGTTTPTLTRAFNFGAGGGTINTAQNAGTGKLVINGTNLLNGTGNITKSGPGWLTLFGTNNGTFAGNWNVNGGVLEVGSATVAGPGAMTVNTGGELAAANGTNLANNVTLAGGTLGADNNTGTYSGAVNVTANSNVRLGNFWNGTSQSTSITGNLSGAGKLTIIPASGVTTSTGTLALTGNNAAFSGGFAIPTGTVAAGLSQGNTLGTGAITLSGGKLALQGQLTPTGAAAAVAAVNVAGFNKDVIYGNPDGAVFATNTAAMDGAFSLYQTGYTPQFDPTKTILNAGTPLSTNGLPGQNITALNTGTPFSFQSFMANNDLQIAKSSTGTLTLATPSAFTTLAVLAASTSAGEDTPNITIHFTDGTSVTTTYKAYDWSIGTDAARQSASAFGAAGIDRYSPSASPGWDQRPFGLYESDINLTNINGVDYSNRAVVSIDFGATSATGGNTNVFAVSGAARSWIAGASQNYTNNVSVTSDSGIDVSGSLSAALGTLAVGSAKLSVTSADATANPYSLSFGSASVTGNATIDVAASSGGGAGTVSLGALTGAGSLTKSNTGTLKLTGTTNSIGGSFNVNAGSVVATGTSTTAGGLSIAAGAKFDLTSGSFDIHYGIGAHPDATIRGYLLTGYNGGTWTGTGLTSSVAAADTVHHAVGYADGADNVVAGLAAGDELVKYTFAGDANLDGKVDVSDLGILASHYGQTSGAGWDGGDFSYDGMVDVSDLGVLASNYGEGTGVSGAAASAQFQADLRLVAAEDPAFAAATGVPEPASFGLLGLAAGATLGRRRRRA